jgi:hypothetical protein
LYVRSIVADPDSPSWARLSRVDRALLDQFAYAAMSPVWTNEVDKAGRKKLHVTYANFYIFALGA